MRFNPDPNEEGTEMGKPLRPASPSLSAYSFSLSLFPATPWPPSLVPTWKTTACMGVCFSRLISNELVIRSWREPARSVASVVPGFRCRETTPLGARARAPPLSIQCTLEKDGGSMVEIYQDACGDIERAKQ